MRKIKDFYVNTDFDNHPKAYKAVLAESKIFAYGDRKHALDNIKDKDRVFVYHNKVGFIAFGEVITPAQNGVHKPEQDPFRFVEIEFKCQENPNSESLDGVNIKYRVRGTCRRIRKTGIADMLAELLIQKFPRKTSSIQCQSPLISDRLVKMPNAGE